MAPDADAAVQELVDRLGAARAAAERIAGRAPLGVRAVEPAAGRRGYVVAFDGPEFLVLNADLGRERDAERARATASASLLWEHVEMLLDPEALRALVGAIGRLLATGGEPRAVAEPLETVAARALELLAWREDPMRAVASVPEIDEGARIQDRLAGAYRRFMRASDPLVAVQDTLPAELVNALRDVEQAAARAGAADRLGDRLAAAMPECQDGAEQMLAAPPGVAR